MLPRFTPKSLSLSPDLKYFQNGPFLGSSLIGLLMSKIKFYWGGRVPLIIISKILMPSEKISAEVKS